MSQMLKGFLIISCSLPLHTSFDLCFLCCSIVYMCWWFLNFLLSYIEDYKNYVKGYFYVIMPLFELTIKDVIFALNFNY
jgi:hypothetical protein